MHQLVSSNTNGNGGKWLKLLKHHQALRTEAFSASVRLGWKMENIVTKQQRFCSIFEQKQFNTDQWQARETTECFLNEV